MARDSIHFIVITALEHDGWSITDDPFILQTGDISVDMELAAEKIFQAERGLEKIIVK